MKLLGGVREAQAHCVSCTNKPLVVDTPRRNYVLINLNNSRVADDILHPGAVYSIIVMSVSTCPLAYLENRKITKFSVCVSCARC